MDKTEVVFECIRIERDKQREMGYDHDHDQSHNRFDWLAIITQETGQLADTLLNIPDRSFYRNVLIKIAAVCVAALEADISDEEAENNSLF